MLYDHHMIRGLLFLERRFSKGPCPFGHPRKGGLRPPFESPQREKQSTGLFLAQDTAVVG